MEESIHQKKSKKEKKGKELEEEKEKITSKNNNQKNSKAKKNRKENDSKEPGLGEFLPKSKENSIISIEASKKGHFEIEFEKISELLQDFSLLQGYDEDEELEFSPNLTETQRKRIHQIASGLKIEHSSIGEGKQRRIIVKQKNEKKSSTDTKEEEKKSKTRYEKIGKGISEILPGWLFLGSLRDARDKETLLQYKIKYILNCAKESKPYHQDTFTHLHVQLSDIETENIKDNFEICFQYLEKARTEQTPILVHCIMGKSRSSSVIIAYLMLSQKWTLFQSYHHVKQKRPLIQPNDG